MVKTFFYNFIVNILKFIFLILPFILLFKSLYVCWHENVFTFQFFSIQFINYIPFFGEILSHSIWDNISLSNINIKNNQYFMEIIFAGGIGSCIARSIIDIFISRDLSKAPIMGSISSNTSNPEELSIKPVLTLFKDSDSEKDSPKGSSSNAKPSKSLDESSPKSNKATEDTNSKEKEIEKSVIVSILGDEVTIDTKDMIKSILDWSKELEKWADFPCPENKLTPGTEEGFLIMLRDQSKIFSIHTKTRMVWVEARLVNALPETRLKIKEIHSNLLEMQSKYYLKAKEIAKLENKASQVKQFYAASNEYRNLVSKELNKIDNILIEDIKDSDLYKHKKLRHTINVEYPKAKKEYNDKDSYIKKRVGEILKNKN